jgi:Tfp pilus assembly protein PilF
VESLQPYTISVQPQDTSPKQSAKLANLVHAKRLAEAKRHSEAWAIVEPYLLDNPDDVDALDVAAFTFECAGNMPVAQAFYRRFTQIAPDDARSWLNYGRLTEDLWQTEEADRCYKRGLSLTKDPRMRSLLYGNLSALAIDNGRFEEGHKYASQSLEANPLSKIAKTNLGFCQLAMGNFADGWKNYRHTLGTSWRPLAQYKNEPQWDGTMGQTVALYGEQGIGDEICFASMVPDAVAISKKVILDVDKRLENLFRRSFPDAKVYGTRQAEPGTKPWDKEDHDIDASFALGQCGEFFRTSRESFPGTPYLKACSIRSDQWCSSFKAMGKPVIGIAWSGGIPKTGAKFRKFDLEDWLPVFAAIDAHWVCLQYKDASKEIAAFREKHPHVDLVQYPWATLTKDYDDTAALVAALDCVIAPPTAVVHLAAALGTKTIAMHAERKCWKFNAGLPFHSGVTLIDHGKGWRYALSDVAKRVRGILNA